MHGLMQDWPLLIHRVIDHAADPARDSGAVVSRSVEGPIHRTNYAELRRRALRSRSASTQDGIGLGDRVATLAWNTWRHLEAWYGITGIGAVYHTVNPRLFDDQIVYIVNHAEDRLALPRPHLRAARREDLRRGCPTIERYVVLTDAAHMPETSLRNAVAYEDWLAEADDDFAWADFDENTAAGMCYTSGTTGKPKGVLYSHRSNVLHSLAGSGARHARPRRRATSRCRWCRCSTPMAGPSPSRRRWPARRSSCPAPKLDGPSVYELLDERAGDDHAPPCRRSGSRCCSIWRRPAASCPTSSAS